MDSNIRDLLKAAFDAALLLNAMHPDKARRLLETAIKVAMVHDRDALDYLKSLAADADPPGPGTGGN
jgi:hypothetical protein